MKKNCWNSWKIIGWPKGNISRCRRWIRNRREGFIIRGRLRASCKARVQNTRNEWNTARFAAVNRIDTGEASCYKSCPLGRDIWPLFAPAAVHYRGNRQTRNSVIPRVIIARPNKRPASRKTTVQPVLKYPRIVFCLHRMEMKKERKYRANAARNVLHLWRERCKKRGGRLSIAQLCNFRIEE